MHRLNYSALSLLAILMMSLLSSCEAIGGIFKAGVWTGLILVVIVIVIIIFIITRFRK